MVKKFKEGVEIYVWGQNGVDGLAGSCLGYEVGWNRDGVRLTSWDGDFGDCYFCQHRVCIAAAAVGRVYLEIYEGETIEQALRERLLDEVETQYRYLMERD